MEETIVRQFICNLCGYIKNVSKTAALPVECPACFNGRHPGWKLTVKDNYSDNVGISSNE